MRKFKVFAIALALVLGLSAGIFAVGKLATKSFAKTETASCCDDGTCKMGGSCCSSNGSCPMKNAAAHQAAATETGEKSCDHKMKAKMTAATTENGESCCSAGASCCAGGASCCHKKAENAGL